MDHRLELTILSESGKTVALARCGANVASRWVKLDQNLPKLKTFRQTLVNQLRGKAPLQKLTPEQIETFGRDLFDAFVGDGTNNPVRDLYRQLKANESVSWQIYSDDSDINNLPWEFLQEPKTLNPRRSRSVVRILPTIGLDPPAPLARDKVTRALLVSAEPQGLRNTDWEQIEARLKREYSNRLPLDLEVIEGTDSVTLLSALRAKQFDLVHFSCHGDASGADGRLVLINRKTKAPDYVKARDIGRVLADRGIRLVVLSACETSLPGSAGTTFGNTAETLIQLGIPAVVANQASIKVPSMAIFIGALYKELTTSGNIDRAMAEARLALSIELPNDPEWGVPTLHRLHGGSQLYTV